MAGNIRESEFGNAAQGLRVRICEAEEAAPEFERPRENARDWHWQRLEEGGCTRATETCCIIFANSTAVQPALRFPDADARLCQQPPVRRQELVGRHEGGWGEVISGRGDLSSAEAEERRGVCDGEGAGRWGRGGWRECERRFEAASRRLQP